MKIINFLSINCSETVETEPGCVSLRKQVDQTPATDIYREYGLNYPKFFKMDVLCQWSWLGAELLLRESGRHTFPAEKVGLVLATRSGCLNADKKYSRSLSSVPSPALFVYTLPNIMLGEISIRHGLKGSQLCLVSENINEAQLGFWTEEQFRKGMDACLTGWVETTDHLEELQMFWSVKR